ncbi:hypothetical protein BDV38DRAFT_239720 [Aspergillus pseudotamarii]|uniref:Uncharacterized protein n=1 Tax=Aspergillus pseudotamarii TaxID=132259 RepID=A0A5N6T2M2_ASPPS|nr:uncharacterized protein BDV38DRAFT_239720 [Aspergillus pseudotamarii]KAE8140451.1 hypothetical protein BDV38DRAFT_239720 [Aspergillus pseudotamarii]
MLPLLFLVVFLAPGVVANVVAGKWQALFFYQLYRLEVEAHGLASSRMAPGCAKAGVVCDMKAFMKEISIVKKVRELDANGKPIQPIKIVDDPDFGKVNWAQLGEGADLEAFGTEFDKVGFKGRISNVRVFKDWKQKDSFATVMSEAEDIALKAIAKLKADGKEPADDRFNKMTAALKTHGDARRYDQAQKIAKDFEEKMTKLGGFSVAYTDPIERPPVPGYRKIDADQTISDNTGRVGFDKVEQTVRDHVAKFNSAGHSPSHVEAIVKTQDVHDHLAEACRK